MQITSSKPSFQSRILSNFSFFDRVKDFVDVVTYRGHKNFVSCVCWLPPCETFHEGLVVTGSNDNIILGYNLQDGTVLVTLESHENAVCRVTPGRDAGILLRLVFIGCSFL